MIYFSENLKYLRKRRGRTQDDVAAALMMKRSTLSGYENKVAQPGIQALMQFSDYFNIAIDTLVKIDLSALSESQMRQLETGFDVYLKGSHLRVLVSTVDADMFFDPSDDKIYRHPTFYVMPEGAKQI